MSEVLLDRVVNVIEKNEQDEKDMIASLKEDYIVRAKAVAYIINANPEAEKDVDELKKIAKLMAVDEIHLLDATGKIYSGTIPEYYGYSFDSGEQMEYFKPMLEDKTLTMCQDVTPNTSEGKKIMYAITWDETGTRMVQVGIEPVRLLNEVKQNEMSSVVTNMPVYEGIRIFVADKESGKIYGATDSSDIGKKLDDIGITKKGDEEGKIFTGINEIDGENYRCSFYITGDYAVGVACSNSSNAESNAIALLIVGIYLTLAAVGIIYMYVKVNKAKIDELTEKLDKGLSLDLLKMVANNFDKKFLLAYTLKILLGDRIEYSDKRRLWLIADIMPQVFCAALYCCASILNAKEHGKETQDEDSNS